MPSPKQRGARPNPAVGLCVTFLAVDRRNGDTNKDPTGFYGQGAAQRTRIEKGWAAAELRSLRPTARPASPAPRRSFAPSRGGLVD